jgi:hypothetical protein
MWYLAEKKDHNIDVPPIGKYANIVPAFKHFEIAF